jgi:predicted amidohydrolase
MRRRSPGELTATLIQSHFAAGDYQSPESFHDKVLGLCEGLPSAASVPRLVVFPELTGLWVPLLRGRRPRSSAALAASLVLRHPLAFLGALASGQGMSFAFRLDWQSSLDAWIEPFREAARRHEAYICPGSTLLPPFDWDPLRGRQLTGRGLYNTSCLISPRGTLLGWTRKLHPLAIERRLGVRAGSLSELQPYYTDLGVVGILLGLDGFHECAVQHLDRLGCRIVVQPSANPLAWERPLRRAAELTQEQQWLGTGLGYLLQGRENLALALNPMSVASVLGQRAEGRSSVFVNPARGLELRGRSRLAEAYRGYSGLAAVAVSCDSEELLTVTVGGLR